MSDSLLQLYSTILVPVFSEWISSIDLCYLDTAVCCTSLRNTFLSRLRKCQISYNDKQFEYDWIVVRGMRLSSIVLYSINEHSNVMMSLVRPSRHLRYLRIPCTREAANLCLGHIADVDELECCSNYEFEALLILLKYCNVTILRLSTRTNYLLKEMCALYPLLKVLHLPETYDVSKFKPIDQLEELYNWQFTAGTRGGLVRGPQEDTSTFRIGDGNFKVVSLDIIYDGSQLLFSQSLSPIYIRTLKVQVLVMTLNSLCRPLYFAARSWSI